MTSTAKKRLGPTTLHPPTVSCQGSVWTLPISLAANLGIPFLVSFPPPTWMLPFGGFLLPFGSVAGVIRDGKSHSGISGSKAACAYPELIAACHALRQRPSRAIRQAAYHAEPFRNPHSICVNYSPSAQQSLRTRHIAGPTQALFALKTLS